MGDYEDTVRILEVELGQVEGAFRGLAEEDWRAPTKLRPLDETKPPWTLFELAGHPTWPATTWPGCGRRRAGGRPIPTRGCR
jgi:hypothetical protein